eukprot:Nk52_evm41s255 gene=Nk52_evmTU41s255
MFDAKIHESIKEFHAHLYWEIGNEKQYECAMHIRNALEKEFVRPQEHNNHNNNGIVLGNVNKGKRGPHTKASMEIIIPKELVGAVVTALQLLRGEEISVLLHPLSGDDLKDHTTYAMWMGTPVELNLTIFH